MRKVMKLDPLDNAVEFHESMFPVMPDDCDNDELAFVFDSLLSGNDFSIEENQVLRMRFGMGFDSDHTLEEVANKLGMKSREKVRQVETKTLRKLRHTSRSRKLEAFIFS